MVIESKSLFDYLGKPAGGELGLEVHAAAVKKDVWIGKKDMEKNIVPAGYVCTYPISFLDEYFNRTPSKPTYPISLEERIKSLEERVLHLEDKYLKVKDDLPF